MNCTAAPPLSAAPDTFSAKRLSMVVGAEVGAYAGAMTLLYEVWYRHNDHIPFHFYNDNAGWMQIDKAGHFYSSYVQSICGLKAMKWAGVTRKKAIIYGGGLGIIMQTTIETLDGFSDGWGASPGDLIANTAGSLLVIGQELAWNEQRFLLKFSYLPSPYTQYRPAYFGHTFFENFIRDYNGHTYWLSGNVRQFIPKFKLCPSWLNIAVGFGADGMLSEYKNPKYYHGTELPVFERRRQLYLSFDVDLSRIHTGSKFFDAVLTGINFIKIPAPGIEYNGSGFKFHPLCF